LPAALDYFRLAGPAQRLPGGDEAVQNAPLGAVLSSLRHWLWGVGAISFVLNLLTLTGPLFMLQVYDRVLVSGSVPTLVAIGSLALALYAFFGVLETLRGRLLLRIGQQVDAKLSAQTFSLSTMIPNWFGAKGGKLRPVEDLDTITRFMSGRGPAAIFDMPWLPFYLAFIFLFHSLLGLVAMSGAIMICVLVVLNELTCRKPSSIAAYLRGRRGSLVEESRRNAEAVHAMGMSDALWGHWNTENATFLERQRVAADWAGFFSSATRTVRFILQSAILAVGAWLVILHEVSPGVMIACSIMTSRALSPVEQAVSQWHGFVSARQAFLRLKTMLRAPVQSDHAVDLPLPEERLVVDQLYCGPSGAQYPVVQGVSLDLRAGDGVGILGPSGAGKSTLVRAIIGTASILKGDIRFDGAALDQWPAEARGKFIGYLPQDLQLFEGTVAQNIARFDPQATSDAIIEAAMLADVHDLIVGLPNGYSTVVGPAGMTLSGGQRQRIALARALYGKPFLLVLDEPNSNLDVEGEAALAYAIETMRERGSIVFVVAHRPRVLAAVDKVLCLNEGRVAAYGPRDDTMRKMLVPVRARERA
jgi:ATP-binding cassette, subfamily C, type I secretion system permease/ATPase